MISTHQPRLRAPPSRSLGYTHAVHTIVELTVEQHDATDVVDAPEVDLPPGGAVAARHVREVAD